MKKEPRTCSEIKRQAIIDAATLAFKEFGVQGTSMDKLAEIAQVSKRTVYNHFATKEALVMHLVTELWEKVLSHTQIDYDPKEDLAVQLSRLIEAEISIMCSQEYLDIARVVLGHLFYDNKMLAAEIEKLSNQSTGTELWIADAVADNRLAVTDIKFASEQLYSLIKGYFFWPQILGLACNPTRQEQDFFIQETVSMFIARYNTN